MFQSKIIGRILFGEHNGLKMPERSGTLEIPGKEEGESLRYIKWAGDDGLILYLIKRIEKLEKAILEKETKVLHLNSKK